MSEFTIINTAELSQEERRQKAIEQLKMLIEARSHKAASTDRYIRMYGQCKPIEQLQMLQRHLKRTIDSIWEMRIQLAHLENTPPRAAVNV